MEIERLDALFYSVPTAIGQQTYIEKVRLNQLPVAKPKATHKQELHIRPDADVYQTDKNKFKSNGEALAIRKGGLMASTLSKPGNRWECHSYNSSDVSQISHFSR